MLPLYTRLAEVYAAIANDRDFVSETNWLIDLGILHLNRSDLAFAELFSGPAYHSVELAKRGLSVTCFEATREMIELAKSRPGMESARFVLGELPSSLLGEQSNTFDLAVVPRFSIGYLKPHQFEQLLWQISRVLTPGGLFVAELHNPSDIRKGLGDISIRTRVATLKSGQRVRVVWPFDEPQLNESDMSIQMKVRIDNLDIDGNCTKSEILESEEQVYTEADFETIGRRMGLSCIRALPDYCFGGEIAVLQKAGA